MLFAGEVFPIAPLRRLRELWPETAMWNLYGPTETNVCTAFPIPARIPPDRSEPFPIGSVCPPLGARVVDEQGRDVPPGSLGELVIARTGRDARLLRPTGTDAAAFFADGQTRWYRTGDLVRDDGTGCFQFHGRRDRMVKKRGYRIELGEIESALYRHDGVDRAGVVAQSDCSRRLDRGVRRAQARSEKVDHRHEAPLHELSAGLHDSRHVHLSGRSAENLDRQG